MSDRIPKLILPFPHTQNNNELLQLKNLWYNFGPSPLWATILNQLILSS